jgi:hypothetical protein
VMYIDLPDLSKLVWRKSSFSQVNGCVEVADAGEVVAVRDSKNDRGSILIFSQEEWAAFLSGVKNGEFERPAADVA